MLVVRLLEAHKALSVDPRDFPCPDCGFIKTRRTDHCLSCRSGVVDLRCSAKGCGARTNYGKPLCTDHIDAMPYVAGVVAMLEA